MMEERVHTRLDTHPLDTRTVDLVDTALPTRMATRIHTPRISDDRQLAIRHHKVGDMLGAGQFGEVYKVLNVDNGELMAMKVIKRPMGFMLQREWTNLKREIENHSRMKHEHIVELLGAQDWDTPQALIFMPLMDGTLETLAESWPGSLDDLSDTVFSQMLKALDYLAAGGWIHRDLKPANILYERLPDGRYHFWLGDLGFCNSASLAKTYVGTPIFMAPEISDGERQTAKVDVWSLFVTILWILDVQGFRQIRFEPGNIQQTIVQLADDPSVAEIRAMAVVDPEERASAAQMLVKFFQGEGLTTPRRLVLPLGPSAGAITRASEVPSSPGPILTLEASPELEASTSITSAGPSSPCMAVDAPAVSDSDAAAAANSAVQVRDLSEPTSSPPPDLPVSMPKLRQMIATIKQGQKRKTGSSPRRRKNRVQKTYHGDRKGKKAQPKTQPVAPLYDSNMSLD